MADKRIPSDLFNMVKKKTGKSVSESDIKNLANGVTPATAQSEQQLRQLIKQVSSLVNVPVSEQTTKEIIDAVKGSKNLGSLEGLMKMLTKKK
ncbi:MAG: stage VI sporulation protein F [Gorillibacterium sp.]|nr:stage VI sporulation protein F [Gorillibacterium sp.]